MKLILKDVRHAPDIHLKLICTSKLDDDAYCNDLLNYSMYVYVSHMLRHLGGDI
jgi:hypothetical protein